MTRTPSGEDLSAYLVEMARCNGEDINIGFGVFLVFTFPKR